MPRTKHIGIHVNVWWRIRHGDGRQCQVSDAINLDKELSPFADPTALVLPIPARFPPA